ncbi:MAG: regulatory protein RecX [Bacteroidia bacterium]|nr:regulatory protein RecX [Bacteroidia bacterium]
MNKYSKNEGLLKAKHLCSKQEFSKSEMLKKLLSWGLNENQANDIIQKLIHENYIDESRYAACFFMDKIRLNKWGKIKIKYELRGKGLSENLISEAENSIGEKEYLQMIRIELEKKIKATAAINTWELNGKLLKFAASRGYEPDIVWKLLKYTPDE